MKRLTNLFLLIFILLLPARQIFSQCTADITGGTSPVCYNNSPGTLTATGGGDPGPYSYQWYTATGIIDGATTSTYNPGNMTATTGFYCAITSGTCGTMNTSVVNITVTPLSSIGSVSGTTPICVNRTTTFSANSVEFGGGTGAWSSSDNTVATVNATTGVVTGVAGGSCNIIYTITGGCGGTKTAQKAITVTPTASIASVTGVTSICINTTTTYTANSVVTGGGAGTWSSSNTSIATVDPASGVVTGVTSGTCNIIYTITGGCGGNASAQQSITVNPNASIGSVSGMSPLCEGAIATYNANSAVFGGGTGSWSSSNTTVATINSSTGLVTAVSSGSSNIVYTITGGCGSTVSAQQGLTVNPVATIGSVSGTTPLCVGAIATYVANSVVQGGGTGSWSSSNTAVATVNSSTGVVTGIAEGSSNIIYTITGGCGGTVSAHQALTVNSTASIGSVIGSSPVCVGAKATYSVSSVVLGGGTGSWSSSNTSVATVDPATGVVTGVASGSCNIVYSITGGCGGTISAQQSVTISPNASISLTSGTGTNNQSICINSPVTGITYAVSGGGTGASVTNLPTGVTGTFNGGVFTISGTPTVAGTFNYTVSTSGTCTQASATGTIVVNSLPTPTLTSSDADHVICSGTSVTFTAGGGTSYAFNVGSTTVQSGSSNTFTTNSLINGQTVNVVVTNSNGCSATSSGIQFFVNSLPFIFISSSPTCSTDLLTYSFSVIVNSGTVTSTAGTVTFISSNTWSITGVPAGVNVTVTVTDSGGCQNTLAVTAPVCSCSVIAAPVSGGDKSYCTSGTVPSVSAVVPSGETVDWYDSSSGGILLKSNSTSYTPSSAGTYYALARNTTNNCVSSTRTAITVTMNSLPVATLVSSDADNSFCSGTSVTFTAGGGANYNFRVNGTSVQNSSSATYTTTTITNGQKVDVIVTSSQGCSDTSSAITNTVKILPVPTLTSSDSDNSICSGTNITFTAGGGNNYNFKVDGTSQQNSASSTYTTHTLTNGQVVSVVVTNAGGCSASSTGITNTVKAKPNPTISSSDGNNIFCSGTSVTFTAGGGSNYNFRVDGTSVQNGTASTLVTSSIANGQSVNVIVTNSSGCSDTSSSIKNTVIPQPVANAGSGGNACDLSFPLKAIPSVGTGTWTKISGTGTASFYPDANTANAVVTVSDYGAYTFRWTEVNGICSSISSVNVNFYLQPVANAGIAAKVCGLVTSLNGSKNVGTGTWSKLSGPGTVTFSPDANTANTSVTVSTFGNYSFIYTVVNGTCSNSDTVSVDFVKSISADAGSGGTECDLDFALNATNSGDRGFWSKLDGPGNAAFTPDSSKANAVVTVDKYGSYDFRWTIINEACTSSSSIKVDFYEKPVVKAINDTIICKGTSLQLDVTGTGTYLWKPVALVSDSTLRNPVGKPVENTTFRVTVTDSNGCSGSDDVYVEVRDNPVADAGKNLVLDYLFEIKMNAELRMTYDTGKWSVLSGNGSFTDPADPETVVKDLSLGKNQFLWTVTNSYCPPSYDTVNVVVNDFLIPTLITPNMDGRNDYFVLRGLTTLGKTELIIFNRRGAEVYKNLNYDNSWNGVDFNGNPLADDTYFYIIKAENGVSKSGFVVIRH